MSDSTLSMNRPTPAPSQEGNRHRSASCPFPSWEGLGVGSWSQCMRKNERGLSMNLPLSLPSPPLWAGERVAEGRERGIQTGSWSQCMRESERRLSKNAAPFVRSSHWEQALLAQAIPQAFVLPRPSELDLSIEPRKLRCKPD